MKHNHVKCSGLAERLSIQEAAGLVVKETGKSLDYTISFLVDCAQQGYLSADVVPPIDSGNVSHISHVDPSKSTVSTAELVEWLDGEIEDAHQRAREAIANNESEKWGYPVNPEEVRVHLLPWSEQLDDLSRDDTVGMTTRNWIEYLAQDMAERQEWTGEEREAKCAVARAEYSNLFVALVDTLPFVQEITRAPWKGAQLPPDWLTKLQLVRADLREWAKIHAPEIAKSRVLVQSDATIIARATAPDAHAENKDFISLSQSLDFIARSVDVPKGRTSGPDEPMWRASEAAKTLYERLHNATDGRPRWMEVHQTIGRSLANDAVADEGMAILLHAAGWYDRETTNLYEHTMASVKAGLDPAVVGPAPRDPNAGSWHYGKYWMREHEIGFVRDELSAFLGMHIEEIAIGDPVPTVTKAKKSMTHNKPNWNVWRHMLKATLFDAVCLSCDVAPGAATLSPVMSGVSHLLGLAFAGWGVSREISDRLSIARSHVGTGGTLPTFAEDKDLYVYLAAFAEWALNTMKWNMPDELRALTTAVKPTGVPPEQAAVSAASAAFHTDPSDGAPPALPTPAIAAAFDGIYSWSADKWSKALGDGRTAWLNKARKSKGRRGRDAATWNPITIALGLKDRHVPWFQLDGVFKKPQLRGWREKWEQDTEDMRD